MHRHLSFVFDEHHTGECITIRRGKAYFSIGDTFETNSGYFGNVKNIQQFRFCDIPLDVLRKMHSEIILGSFDFGFLQLKFTKTFLSNMYHDFRENEIVTVITYIELSEHIGPDKMAVIITDKNTL